MRIASSGQVGLADTVADPPFSGVARGTAAYRRISIALFLAGFSTFSLLYCVQPLLPVFTAAFGVSPAVSSLSLSLSTGFLALAILGAAAVSEGLGRRGLMFASMTLAAAFERRRVDGAELARAAGGPRAGGIRAGAACRRVAMTYLAEEMHPRGLGYAMGLYVAGTAFGGMIGRVGTGMLADYVSWRFALAAIGVAGLASAAGFVLLLPASRNFVRRRGFDAHYHLGAWSGHLRHSALALLFAVGFLVMGAFVTVYNYAGFRLMAPPYGLDQTELGLIFTVYLFGIAASSAAGGLGGPDRPPPGAAGRLHRDGGRAWG